MTQPYTILDVKQRNLRSMIDYMRFKEYVIKKTLAQDLDLSFSTVSNTLNDLITIGLLRQTEADNGRMVGRSPKGYTIAPDRFGIVVMDLRKAKRPVLSLVNLHRQVLCTRELSMPDAISPEAYFEHFAALYRQFLAEEQGVVGGILGSTAVVAGVYDLEKDVLISSYNAVLRRTHLKAILSEITDTPVWIENDINCAAYYETTHTGIPNMAYLFINEHLGLGAVMDGKLLRGANGTTSELAHIPMGLLDRPCYRGCAGNHCLESDLSINGYLSKYSGEMLSWATPHDELASRWEQYLQAVAQGDAKARSVMEENCDVLGRALCAVASLLRPEKIVIGGFPRPLFEAMKEPIETMINSREHYDPLVGLHYDAQFGQTMILGAAELAYHDWKPDIDMLLKAAE